MWILEEQEELKTRKTFGRFMMKDVTDEYNNGIIKYKPIHLFFNMNVNIFKTDLLGLVMCI